MDIIVTTPKDQMEAAAAEAEEIKRAGSGLYFHRLPCAPRLAPGEKVWFVEDGYLRGYCLAISIETWGKSVTCSTTGQTFLPGIYVVMDATMWRWINPIPMRGFQGFRYAEYVKHTQDYEIKSGPKLEDKSYLVSIVGGWLLDKPDVTKLQVIEPYHSCGHAGCLSHVSHPCEVCGRRGGKGWAWIDPARVQVSLQNHHTIGQAVGDVVTLLD